MSKLNELQVHTITVKGDKTSRLNTNLRIAASVSTILATYTQTDARISVSKPYLPPCGEEASVVCLLTVRIAPEKRHSGIITYAIIVDYE